MCLIDAGKKGRGGGGCKSGKGEEGQWQLGSG